MWQPFQLCYVTALLTSRYFFLFFCGVSILGQGGARQTFMDEGNVVWGGCYRMQRGSGRSPKIPQTKPQSGKALSPVMGSDCYPLFLLLIRADEARARGWRTQRSLPMGAGFCVVGAKLSTFKPRCLVEVSNSLA